ncbi:MAG: hypothetical protein JWO25_2275 [Alphaproteobacteria bacterium]|nr:hypothetical protein [Alphaproteobacteria bacterium]MDB5723020.1 hypothetical protein [Alphaproteobacteria bacterium]
MATDPGPSRTTSLVDRVKNILMQPKTEWPLIAAEPATIAGIYRNYVVILAAIGPICMMIGLMLMGGGFIHFATSFLIGQAILSYILALVGVYVIALIIDALAPTFGGVKSQVGAFKVAAYSMTASWVAGVLFIIPLLGILALVAAIYGFYLLYLGLPAVMKAPADKVVGYTIAVVIASIIVLFLISTITTRAMYAMMPQASPVSTITFSAPAG